MPAPASADWLRRGSSRRQALAGAGVFLLGGASAWGASAPAVNGRARYPHARAVSAASAGMDLILCAARDATQAGTATTALASALTSGQLGRTAFSAAVSRVTALRAGLF